MANNWYLQGTTNPDISGRQKAAMQFLNWFIQLPADQKLVERGKLAKRDTTYFRDKFQEIGQIVVPASVKTFSAFNLDTDATELDSVVMFHLPEKSANVLVDSTQVPRYWRFGWPAY